MNQNPEEKSFLFKPGQFLGPPKIFPPIVSGKIPVSVQFVIPGLKVGNKTKKTIVQLAYKSGADIWGVETNTVENSATKDPATHVTIAFYINLVNGDDEKQRAIISSSRLLVEHFLGLLSFSIGAKLSAVHIQPTTINDKGQYSQILSMSKRTQTPTVKVDFSAVNIENSVVSDDIFSALSWLRRGLAERDSIENFSALMVCLQIMARHIVTQPPIVHNCPSCGVVIDTQGPSITSLMRELIVTHLNASTELFDRLWKARNAIVAHGNLPITPEVLIELTELKFDAATLAFNSIKLGLGMPLDSPPLPNPAFFVTDAFMYID